MAKSDKIRTFDHRGISAALIDALGQQATATLYEAAGQRGAMDAGIRATSPGLRLCGPALTVRCQPADNLTLHTALSVAEPGDVIVADVADFVEAGHWGEVLTVAAQARGVAGLVINGGVRDVEPCRHRAFPVFARSVSMKAAVKQVVGTINHPIVCGGVTVGPGDLVVADDDGVVVIAQDEAETVLRAAQAREQREAEIMSRLAAGELTLDILSLRPLLERQ